MFDHFPQYPFVVVIPLRWKSKFTKNTVKLKDIIHYPFLMLGPMKGYSMYEYILGQLMTSISFHPML